MKEFPKPEKEDVRRTMQIINNLKESFQNALRDLPDVPLAKVERKWMKQVISLIEEIENE